MAWIGPDYIGPALPAAPEGETVNFWGIRTRRVPHQGGAYDEQVFHPLAAAKTLDDVAAYPWPQAGWFDYSGLRERGQKARETKVVQCGYMAPFYFHSLLRGMEQSLLDPLLDPELTHEIVSRICGFFYDHHRRIFEACGGAIDVAQVTDDLGSQTGPLLVEMGIDILNPVQWTCPGMDMDELKAEFGGRVCFHGGIENQRILPFGTPEEVRAEVRHCIDALASDGTGYILAPGHNIQVVSPVENIIALYDEAWRYGRRVSSGRG